VSSAIKGSPPSDDLSLPSTTRWVVRREAAIDTAVRSGSITPEEAVRRWQVSEEEYDLWRCSACARAPL